MERIGWVGTGVMGAPMVGHLLAAGYEVDVFNRTQSRADGVVARGARRRASVGELAAGADVVVTMVGYPDDVRATVLGGVLDAMRPGSLLIDMTTSEPSLAEEIAAAAAERGVGAVDAPVSGGDVGARNGQLVVMAGGSEAAVARARPIFDTFAKAVVHEGGPGAGQHTKMVNQIAIAAGMVAMCEALLYAERAGLDLETAVDTISGGAAASFSLTAYAPRLLAGDLEPGFKIDHFVKDLGIALREARRMGLQLPGLELAACLYKAASASGLGAKGTQALLVELARRSGSEWPRLAGDA